MVQISDPEVIGKWVDRVLEENPGQLEQFRGGKTKLQGFFAGCVAAASILCSSLALPIPLASPRPGQVCGPPELQLQRETHSSPSGVAAMLPPPANRQLMKVSKGQGNPGVMNKMLNDRLKRDA